MKGSQTNKKKDIPQTQRNESKNPWPLFITCLWYLGPHHYNNIVRANETMEINPQTQKYDVLRTYQEIFFCWGRFCIVARTS